MDAEWAKSVIEQSRDRIAAADGRAARLRASYQNGTWDDYLKELAEKYGINIDTGPDAEPAEREQRSDIDGGNPRGGGDTGAAVPQDGGEAESGA